MAYRGDDRYYDAPRRSRAELDEVQVRERTRVVSRSPPRREYTDNLRFLREDVRTTDAGALVLRQRDVETVERPRRRSPSPIYRERIVRRARSLTPPRHDHEHEREREVVHISERERVRSPSRGPSTDRLRARFVERTRSPSPERLVRTRVVEQRRVRSPSPVEHEHIRTRIVERQRERAPSIVSSSSSSPSPPPQVIRGPVIERQVITHYHDIDHGVTKVPSPPPPPAPPRIVRRTEERELDIDISTSRHHTDIDIHRSTSRVRGRSPSRERKSPRYVSDHVHEDKLVVSSSRNELRVEDRHSHRRARSAAPLRSPVREEAEYITSKINSRGRMGEAYHGATRDWTIVDVPPGTERVRMDGVGGGAAEVTWQRYNGVRRARFIPESDGVIATSSSATIVSEPPPRASRDRLSVQVYDRETDVNIEKVTDRRVAIRPPAPRKKDDMWTEITKDLVVREAILEMGYEFEETEYFFYIMEYLRYDDVLQLVQISDDIRRYRQDRRRYERDLHREDIDIRLHHHHHHHNRRPRRAVYDDGRVVEREREVIYDDTRWR